MTKETTIPTFKPFLGRIIVEAIGNDTEQYLRKELGMENSVLALPENVINQGRVPITRGVIISKGDVSFGDRFEKFYGKDAADEGRSLQKGDIIQFVANQSQQLAHKSPYYIVSDEHILGYERVTTKVKSKEVLNG